MSAGPTAVPRAADSRPGSHSAGLAFARQRSFASANALGIATVVAVSGAAAAVLVIWAPGSSTLSGFAAGVLFAGVVGYVAHWIAVASGSTSSAMGQAAEEWTTTELRRLRRRGWRSVNSVMFRKWDVDHIAVGPNGVLVIETKWRSDPIDLAHPDEWLIGAAERLRRNERDVAGYLGWGAKSDAWITSVLVVWGPQITQPGDEPLKSPHGVKVLAGEHLRRNLAELTERALSDEEIAEVVAKLDTQARKRDQPESTSWQTIQARANRALLVVLMGFVGAFISLLAVQLGWWYFPVAAGFAAIGAAAYSVERLRAWGLSWLIGTQTVTVAFAVAILVLAVTG